MSYNPRDELLCDIERILDYFGIEEYSIIDKSSDFLIHFKEGSPDEEKFVNLMIENKNRFADWGDGSYRFENIGLLDVELFCSIVNGEI